MKRFFQHMCCSVRSGAGLLLILSMAMLPLSCKPDAKTAEQEEVKATPVSQPKDVPVSVRYVDVTQEAGISFRHNNGAFGKKYLPESMGSGCAFLDINNDGWQDILLVNSTNWPERKGEPSFMALYLNNKDGTFTDITASAGLKVEMFGMGVTAADYDNDGDTDIYITALQSDRLFRNNGNNTFTDVTDESGISNEDFATSATWFDYDKDGLLDLFVCNYVKWTKETDLYCTIDGKNKSYCTPESYPGASSRLYRNAGGGKFQNVTRKAGLYDPTSKALGLVALDYDRDGWMDLFVANDTERNKLYRNEGNGTFRDQGVPSGVAYSEAGVVRAGMGVDAAVYDDTGYPSLAVGNFSNEMIGLYHNEGSGLFIDEAPASAVGQDSLLTLTFGLFFFDYDLDGRPDLFAANGHVHDDIQKVQSHVTYAQKPHLFRNAGNRRFEHVTEDVGGDFSRQYVARGAAYGDYDNDGDLDILISTNGGPAVLLRNDGGNANNFVRLRLIGSSANRDAIGAKAAMEFEDGFKQWLEVKAGASYCSQNELPLTFGLGKRQKVTKLKIVWPSGNEQVLPDVQANQTLDVLEQGTKK